MSGRSPGSPHVRAENGIPAATVTEPLAGSTVSDGAARTASTAGGRSDMPGRYQPAAIESRATWQGDSRPASLPATATVAFVIFVGLGAVSFVGGTVLPASDGLRFGFPSYYTSSRLVLEREWGPAVYDNAWFSERSRDLTGGTVAEIYRPNTPMMSLLAIPIAWMDIAKARRVWLAVDLALVVADDRRPARRAPGPAVAAARGRAHRPLSVVGAAA